MKAIQDGKTPIGVISNGEYTETAYLLNDGGVEFAEGQETTLGPGGMDPQDAPKLIGEKTGVVEATYGDVELGEFEEEFRGRDGLVLFHKMLTDSSIQQALGYHRDELTNAKWRVIPASEDTEDLEIAAHCADQLGLNDMRAGKYSFQRLLSLYEQSRVYRQSFGELVFAPGPDGKIVLDKINTLHPFTIDSIEYDTKGGPKTLVQKGKLRGEKGKQIEKKIPIWKTVMFVNQDDGVNTGESVLRPAVIHWRIKRALMILMNQGLERFALGVPMLTVPATVKPDSDQWKAARQVCIDYVTRPRMGVVVPTGWEFEILKMSGQLPEIIPYMEYHDRAIMRSLGIEGTTVGLKEGQNSPGDAQTMTAKAITAMLTRFTTAINLYVIPKIVMLNWPNATSYPRLVAETESEDDISAAANLFGMVLNAAVDMTIAEMTAEQAKVQAELSHELAVQQQQIDKELGEKQVQVADKKAAQKPAGPAGAPGKTGSVAGGASRKASGGASRTPTKKFGEYGLTAGIPEALHKIAEFAEGNPAAAAGGKKPPVKPKTGEEGSTPEGAPEGGADIASKIKANVEMIKSIMPTRMKRLVGWLEDEQRAALDQYRQSAQTVRTADGRKPPNPLK